MDEYFSFMMARMSDAELLPYITNPEKYTYNAVHTAIAELQKRGRHFDEAEIAAIEARIPAPAEEPPVINMEPYKPANQEATINNEVKERLYSPLSIFIFSLLFTPIAGATLLAMNLKERKAKNMLIAAGIGYTLLSSVVLSLLMGSAPRMMNFASLLLSAVAGFVLVGPVWNKYIGKDTRYTPRPAWVPLIVCLLIAVAIAMVALNAGMPLPK